MRSVWQDCTSVCQIKQHGKDITPIACMIIRYYNLNLNKNREGMGRRDPIFRKSTCYRPVILHALKSFLYLSTEHASMESVQQDSLKKLTNATSKHFHIVLLIIACHVTQI